MSDFIHIWLLKVPPLPDTLLGILGTLTIIFRVIDGIKYHVQANKIRRLGSAKGQSRVFIILAALSDCILILWIVFRVKDSILFITSVLALVFVLELFWVTYLYYDYRRYPKELTVVIKRPNMLLYLWNTLLPNSKRKHL